VLVVPTTGQTCCPPVVMLFSVMVTTYPNICHQLRQRYEMAPKDLIAEDGRDVSLIKVGVGPFNEPLPHDALPRKAWMGTIFASTANQLRFISDPIAKWR